MYNHGIEYPYIDTINDNHQTQYHTNTINSIDKI